MVQVSIIYIIIVTFSVQHSINSSSNILIHLNECQQIGNFSVLQYRYRVYLVIQYMTDMGYVQF